jgi:hypothetical protein
MRLLRNDCSVGKNSVAPYMQRLCEKQSQFIFSVVLSIMGSCDVARLLSVVLVVIGVNVRLSFVIFSVVLSIMGSCDVAMLLSVGTSSCWHRCTSNKRA